MSPEEILSSEALDMGRPCTLIDSAVMAHGVVAIVYAVEPFVHGEESQQQIRTATWVRDMPKYSTIVSTRWTPTRRWSE